LLDIAEIKSMTKGRRGPMGDRKGSIWDLGRITRRIHIVFGVRVNHKGFIGKPGKPGGKTTAAA